MTFEEILQQTVDILQNRGRISYRALQRQFDLDDDYLDDVKAELLYAYSQVVDEGRGMAWTGERIDVSPTPAAPAPFTRDELARAPCVYTPQHLVEKILTSHAALKGEYKQVTVLFCDLANSTGLAEQLGPESMHTVLNQFFALALGAIHRYEGTINQFLGDGFMALFGAPIAHEDHARRAVFAALELRRQILVYNAAHDRPADCELALRMGLNTGPVVVGAIGDNLRMDYTAVGDTTNVAARLEHEAASNQIVLSHQTHRLVEGYCTTRALGAFVLKGKAEPLQAWEVITAQENRTRLEVDTERGLTPFVGRFRELQTLHECFAQAQAGHGQVVFLVGEAGIGKSRLLMEFRRQLDHADATWLEGHTMSFGTSMVFHPLIDLLKRHFRIEEGDAEETIITKIEQHVLTLGEDLRPLLPFLRYLLSVDPGDASVQRMDPQLRRADLFEALQRLLLRAAEVRPQVLVLEDLHWIDQATEDFVRAVTDRIPTSRVLCLFTYRPNYLHPFGDKTYHTHLVIPMLSTVDMIHMAQALLGTEVLPQELQTLIVQKAEGNPFFVEEVVKSLQEAGVIRQVGARYVLTKPLEEIVVPDTIQDVLMARIDRLDASPKKTLQHAAVIGREFTYRLVQRLADIQERTEVYLRDLKTLELIYEKTRYPELVYRFKHALTQDVTYHSLLLQRRKELHQMIGHAMEDLYADRLAEHYEVLAYHFARGNVWEKALEYFSQAAKKATQALATHEALSLYEQALEAAHRVEPPVAPPALLPIHQAKVDLYVITSDYGRAWAEGERYLALAQEAGDQMHEGVALVGMGMASILDHHIDQGLTYAQRAIAVAQAADAKEIQAGGHSTAGLALGVLGRLDLAWHEIDQAIIVGRDAGAVAHESFALGFAGLMKNWAGEFTEASQLCTQALAIAREHSLLMPHSHTLLFHAFTLIGTGDYDAALGALEEEVSLAAKVGDEAMHLRALNTLGWLYIELGALDRAIAPNQQSAEGGRQRNDVETAANAEINLGDLFLAKGDLALAREFFDGVYRLAKDPTTTEWLKWRYSMHLFASFGEWWLAYGDPSTAQEFIEQGLEIATRTNSRKYLVQCRRLQGNIALACGLHHEAAYQLQQALTLAQTLANPTQLWKTHLSWGQLHDAAHRREMAQQSYQAAQAVIDQIKANVQTPDLRANMGYSPMMQQVYDLTGGCCTNRATPALPP